MDVPDFSPLLLITGVIAIGATLTIDFMRLSLMRVRPPLQAAPSMVRVSAFGQRPHHAPPSAADAARLLRAAASLMLP